MARREPRRPRPLRMGTRPHDSRHNRERVQHADQGQEIARIGAHRVSARRPEGPAAPIRYAGRTNGFVEAIPAGHVITQRGTSHVEYREAVGASVPRHVSI